MAFKFGFFNAKNLDRTYTAEDFCDYLSSLICNGVHDNYGDNFEITAGTDLNVILGTGKAWINGHYFLNDVGAFAIPTLAGIVNTSPFVYFPSASYERIKILCSSSTFVLFC